MKLFGAKIMIYDSKQSILAGIDIYIFFERLYRVFFFKLILLNLKIMSVMNIINKISEGERLFIINGVDLNIRSDGRSCDDHRMVMIEQNVIETCSGSAHARSGNTDVLVGIKLELEEIVNSNDGDDDDKHQAQNGTKGRVQVFADISAIASPAFEGRKGEDITCQIEALFSEFLPDFIDLEKLIIVPNRSYFVLHIDIVILECSSLSSLIDITSIAIKTALNDVRYEFVFIKAFLFLIIFFSLIKLNY